MLVVRITFCVVDIDRVVAVVVTVVIDLVVVSDVDNKAVVDRSVVLVVGGDVGCDAVMLLLNESDVVVLAIISVS